MARNIIPQITVVARREALVQVSGYDPGLRYAEDFDLWHRLAVHSRFVHAPLTTAHYRVHPAQASSRADELLVRGWEVRIRHFHSLCDDVPHAADETGVKLAQAWEADLHWTVRGGRRDLFDCLDRLRPSLLDALGRVSISPRQVRWSRARAHLHALKRRVLFWRGGR